MICKHTQEVFCHEHSQLNFDGDVYQSLHCEWQKYVSTLDLLEESFYRHQIIVGIVNSECVKTHPNSNHKKRLLEIDNDVLNILFEMMNKVESFETVTNNEVFKFILTSDIQAKRCFRDYFDIASKIISTNLVLAFYNKIIDNSKPMKQDEESKDQEFLFYSMSANLVSELEFLEPRVTENEELLKQVSELKYQLDSTLKENRRILESVKRNESEDAKN